MCFVVQVRGKWCETVKDLRDAVPCVPVKEDCYDAMLPDNACLCGVDIPSTLTAAGVEFTRDDCGDFHVST